MIRNTLIVGAAVIAVSTAITALILLQHLHTLPLHLGPHHSFKNSPIPKILSHYLLSPVIHANVLLVESGCVNHVVKVSEPLILPISGFGHGEVDIVHILGV